MIETRDPHRDGVREIVLEEMIEAAARIAHEVNRAYCNSLGDASQPDWNDAPDWQKDSARNGMKMHAANPHATPEESHKSWLKQKEAEGWTYGEHKDATLKTHPCFRPYRELPRDQRVKDYLFKAVAYAIFHQKIQEKQS